MRRRLYVSSGMHFAAASAMETTELPGDGAIPLLPKWQMRGKLLQTVLENAKIAAMPKYNCICGRDCLCVSCSRHVAAFAASSALAAVRLQWVVRVAIAQTNQIR